jgi:hypothetical protein
MIFHIEFFTDGNATARTYRKMISGVWLDDAAPWMVENGRLMGCFELCQLHLYYVILQQLFVFHKNACQYFLRKKSNCVKRDPYHHVANSTAETGLQVAKQKHHTTQKRA